MKALIICLLLLSSPAQAICVKQIYTDFKTEPDYNCPSPGEDALVPRLELKASVSLKAKDKSPWDGILLDKNRVLTVGLRITALRRLRYLDMKAASEQKDALLKFETAQHAAALNLRTAQRDNYKSQTVALQKEVIRLNKWYRSPALWFAAGFVVAATGAAVLAYGLRK